MNEVNNIAEKQRIENALSIAFRFGQIDGAHHKAWVIDQIVRALCGCEYNNDYEYCDSQNQEYQDWVYEYCYGEGVAEDDYYEWEIGIIP